MKRPLCTGAAALFFLCLFVFLPLPALGQSAAAVSAPKAFPDFLSVRSEFLSALVTAPTASAVQFKSVVRESSGGKVRVSVEQAGPVFYILFLREHDGAYPLASRGNIIIKRESSTGYLKAVKWFLSDDGKSFLVLTPKNERTLVDYVVNNAVVRSGIVVNTLVYYFIMQDFSYLYNALKSSIKWNFIFAPSDKSAADDIQPQLAALGAGTQTTVPANHAALLLEAISDISTIPAYFKAIGKPAAEMSEIVTLPFTMLAKNSDVREGSNFIAVSASQTASGFSLSLVPPIVTLSTESVFFVLVDSTDAKPARKLLSLVVAGTEGVRTPWFYDVDNHKEVDFSDLLAARPEARVRVFQLPLPN